MRAKMLRVEAPADAIDVVGTAGDAFRLLQHLDLRAFSSLPVLAFRAKHGNRALSSRCGAADGLPRLA